MNLLKQDTRPATSYRLIPLTQGQFAIVDAADYEWLNQWKWYADWSPGMQNFYARRNSPSVDCWSFAILMHREILGLQRGDKREGDHIASDRTLDNRRNNLRIVGNDGSSQNRKRYRNNTSGYKGVHLEEGKYWRAYINVSGKRINLGVHPTAESAYAAYCAAAKKYHGEFAHLG